MVIDVAHPPTRGRFYIGSSVERFPYDTTIPTGSELFVVDEETRQGKRFIWCGVGTGWVASEPPAQVETLLAAVLTELRAIREGLDLDRQSLALKGGG